MKLSTIASRIKLTLRPFTKLNGSAMKTSAERIESLVELHATFIGTQKILVPSWVISEKLNLPTSTILSSTFTCIVESCATLTSCLAICKTYKPHMSFDIIGEPVNTSLCIHLILYCYKAIVSYCGYKKKMILRDRVKYTTSTPWTKLKYSTLDYAYSTILTALSTLEISNSKFNEHNLEVLINYCYNTQKLHFNRQPGPLTPHHLKSPPLLRLCSVKARNFKPNKILIK